MKLSIFKKAKLSNLLLDKRWGGLAHSLYTNTASWATTLSLQQSRPVNNSRKKIRNEQWAIIILRTWCFGE
jgi:hypothetical protein